MPADFSKATKQKIRNAYNNRCAICLQKLPGSRSSHCAHLFDRATAGAKQLKTAVDAGVVSSDYKRNSAENGMLQCPTCHLAFFTSERVALSLPPQLLQYITEYFWATDKDDRKPLREVFRLLNDAVQGVEVDLPNTTSVLPFLDLYTLVNLLPDELNGTEIAAHHLPDLFVRDGNQFIPAPPDTLPDAPGVARIFDVSTISDTLPTTYYAIPLSSKNAEFTHQRYWRVPVRPEVVLMMLMERVRRDTHSGCEEINHVKVIKGILYINQAGIDVVKLTNSRKRPSEGREDVEPPRKLSRRKTDSGSAVWKEKSGLQAQGTRKRTKSPTPGPHRPKLRRIKLKI